MTQQAAARWCKHEQARAGNLATRRLAARLLPGFVAMSEARHSQALFSICRMVEDCNTCPRGSTEEATMSDALHGLGQLCTTPKLDADATPLAVSAAQLLIRQAVHHEHSMRPGPSRS